MVDDKKYPKRYTAGLSKKDKEVFSKFQRSLCPNVIKCGIQNRRSKITHFNSYSKII